MPKHIKPTLRLESYVVGRHESKIPIQSVHLTNYQQYKKKYLFGDNSSLHEVAQVFENWQRPLFRRWKWNDAHRHKSEEQRVPWHDTRNDNVFQEKEDFLMSLGYPRPYFFLIPDMNNRRLNNNERKAIFKIRVIKENMKLKERKRMRSKMRWWQINVTGARYFQRELICYQSSRQVPDLMLSIFLEQGKTFRHIRENGYIPFCNEDDDEIQDMTNNLLTQASNLHTQFAIDTSIWNL